MPETIGFIGGDPREEADPAVSAEALHAYYDLNYRPWLPSDRGASLLDYGSGAGRLLGYLEKLGYRDTTGFDVDSRYAAFCRAHLKANIVHDPDAMRFLRNHGDRYDFVSSMQVVCYFPRSSLQEWFTALGRTLRPGGSLLVDVFNGAGLVGAWPFVNDPFVQTVFSESLLAEVLERAGLRILELRDEKVPSRGLRRAAWKLGRRAWAGAVRAIYLIERGADGLNPRFVGKNLVAVAQRR